MKRKNIIKMFSLCLFIMFFMALATIGRPNLNLSTADNITDATGDIIEMDGNAKTWKATDLHTEIDIDTMIHSGQNFTITLHGTVPTSTPYTYYFFIYEDINDPSTTYNVMLNLYTTSGYLMNPSYQYWTTSGWTSYPYDPVIVGTINGSDINIAIPSAALAIQTSHNWYFMSMYAGANNMTYADICPDSLQSAALLGFSGPGGGIYGYDLPVLIGIIAMFSIIFIFIYKKRIKN